MEKVLMKFKKTAKYTSIEVKESEFILLKILSDVKILSSKNMHLYYRELYSGQRSQNAISQRLKKLVDAGVLKRMSKPTKYNTLLYFYKLGNRGYLILEQEGYLTPKQVESRKKYQYATKVPPPHNEGVASCIIHLMATLQKKEVSLEVIKTSQRGEVSNHFLMNAHQRVLAEIVPDWVMETDEYLICLEIDTGNQSLPTIRNKYERYCVFLTRKELEKTLLVIFVSLDKGTPRMKRVGSLKSAFPSMEEWPEKLELMVLPSSRLSDVLMRVLTDKLSIHPVRQKKLSYAWMKTSIQQVSSLHSTSMREVYTDKFFDEEFIAPLLMVILPYSERELGVIAISVEEGAVRSRQWVEKLIKRIPVMNLSKAVNYHLQLLLVYETSDGAEEDVLGVKPLNGMYGVSLEALTNAAPGEWKYPFEFQYLTHYQKKNLPWIK